MGQPVRSIQTYLHRISKEYKDIPNVIPDGNYGIQTKQSVEGFQVHFNLKKTGTVDNETWNRIHVEYNNIIETSGQPIPVEIYPDGKYKIPPGAESINLYVIQSMMFALSKRFPTLGSVEINGKNENGNIDMVIKFQHIFGIDETGVIDKKFWNNLAGLYETLISKRDIIEER